MHKVIRVFYSIKIKNIPNKNHVDIKYFSKIISL